MIFSVLRSHVMKTLLAVRPEAVKKVKLLSNQSVAKINRNKTKTNVNLVSDQYFPIQGFTNNVPKLDKKISFDH